MFHPHFDIKMAFLNFFRLFFFYLQRYNIRMTNFKMRLAEKNIEVDCLDPYTREYCKDFLIDDSLPCEESFVINEDDIKKEMDLECNRGSYGSPELSCLYRKIVTRFVLDDILLFHCSSIAIHDKAYCIAAHSGVGKSTHVRILRKVYQGRITCINDDKPLLRFEKDHIEVYGTPWNGKERLSNNIHKPLDGICFLSRGQTNSIRRISPKKAFDKMISQVYRPSGKTELIKTLSLVDRTLSTVPLYDLRVNMKDEAATVSYMGMVERKGL